MTTLLTTSLAGQRALIADEGEVLKTYRDVVGIKTIGVGLTKASGVIDPKMGMTITRAESRRLLAKALARNYEPAVRRAMGDTTQHAFDGAVGFHWNTGAIERASWVAFFNRKSWDEAERRFKQWNKAGGKVWRGLVLRRDREWKLMRHGVYHGGSGKDIEPNKPAQIHAPKFVFPSGSRVIKTLSTPAEVYAALASLGYIKGASGHVSAAEVMRFQTDHDLTTDGIVGPATLATIQRRIDARRKLSQTAAAGGAGGAVEVAPNPTDLTVPEGSGLIIAGVATLVGLWLLWQYRDWIAVKVQRVAPGLARWLRAR